VTSDRYLQKGMGLMALTGRRPAEIFFSASFSLPRQKLPFPASSSTASSKLLGPNASLSAPVLSASRIRRHSPCAEFTLPASRQGMFMRELDNGAELEAIKVPSLIIQGKDDRIVLSASSDNIARHIPHISRVDYDHCGHVPFVEAAEQFNRDVAAFMQRVHG
jgi:pimeloyl-ACP methyl ester carboxylesterase